MQYTTLGSSGVKVSRLCLGTMNFGMASDQRESFAVMDCALEHGINFFDTADFYGTPPGNGITEEIVGQWLHARGTRDQIVLETKAYASMGNMGVNDRGLSAYHLRRACEESLRRLKTDHIDVYMLHHYDRGYRFLPEMQNIGRSQEENFYTGVHGTLAPPMEETLSSIDTLRRNDKITYLGTANFSAWALTHLNGLARQMGIAGSVVEQCHYNLNSRRVEIELLPACRFLGIGVMPYSPLDGGTLAGFAALKERKRFHAESIPPEMQEKLRAFDSLCKELGETPADISLAWLLYKNGVTSVLLGPRNVAQLENSLHALDITLPEDFVKALERIWAGPEAEAPEYYGW